MYRQAGLLTVVPSFRRTSSVHGAVPKFGTPACTYSVRWRAICVSDTPEPHGVLHGDATSYDMYLLKPLKVVSVRNTLLSVEGRQVVHHISLVHVDSDKSLDLWSARFAIAVKRTSENFSVRARRGYSYLRSNVSYHLMIRSILKLKLGYQSVAPHVRDVTPT